MTLMNTMREDDLLELRNLLNDSKEEAILFVENKLQIRSKKKRVQKKFRKKIMLQLSQLKNTYGKTETNNQPTVDVSTLPVTFVLGLGKEYFSELEVVKYYYSKTKEEYYKNKELLFETINQAISDEASSVRNEIMKKVEEKQK